ncbi:MAG: hypothetical protein P8Y18_10405 [Candidatus Bathyarchaeota archaeon]
MENDNRKKYLDLKFVLSPVYVARGKQKLILRIQNTGDAILRNMNLIMHPLDENLKITYAKKFVYSLLPGQITDITFPVSISSDTKVYCSLSGFKNGDVLFSIDSANFNLIMNESESNYAS